MDVIYIIFGMAYVFHCCSTVDRVLMATKHFLKQMGSCHIMCRGKYRAKACSCSFDVLLNASNHILAGVCCELLPFTLVV